jgi:hypothetical protein
VADVRDRTCEACGAVFSGRKRRFCYDCLVEHRQDPVLYARQYGALYRVDITCIDCGKVVRAYSRTTRCRVCTEKRRQAGMLCKECRKCGALFVPRGKGFGRRTFCSDACATRVCPECGKEFFDRAGQRCSAACIKERELRQNREASRRRSIRRRGAIKGPYHDLEIFDRDGWRCQICKGLTRPWHRVPHPLAPTIDHIVPVSKGGDDVATNVQCAHFRCNTRKQAGAADDQLRLVG